MNGVEMVLFTFLFFVFAVIDFRNKAIPSVLLTGFLLVLLFIRFEFFQWALISAFFGILLWEFSDENEVAFGLADIKVIAMLGFFIGDLLSMAIFLISFSFGMIIYFFVMRKWSRFEEIPFIPFLFAIWIGGLAGGLWV